MSSWVIAKNKPANKKQTITKYHTTASSPDIISLYMNYLSAFIFNQKNGEICNVYDPSITIRNTLKVHPQIKLLKEQPEDLEALPLTTYSTLISSMKFKDIQKFATGAIEYNSSFKNQIIQTLNMANINNDFDIGIHLIRDISGPNLPEFKKYIDLLKSFQQKSIKRTLSIYIMADSPTVLGQFKTYCDPTWKITTITNIIPRNVNEENIKLMSDIHIMSKLPAIILDFSRVADRFIYLMQRNKDGFEHFVEINSAPWYLI